MMKFLKKETKLTTPTSGIVKPISDVADEVFSNKLMGDGFAITPLDTEIYAPVSGEITSIFPTKHAISILTKTGISILIHIGIDTVDLNGEGFDISVSEGEKVTPRTKIATVDFNYLKNQNKETDVMVIFPELKGKSLDINYGNYTGGDEIGKLY